MSGEQTGVPAEIVIVRRRGGDDGAAHKGGAWKIAYADFVTAMMAFFLVMWLINASNEKTRAQVASYFNPIKLTDSSTGKRGVKNSKEAKQDQKHDGTEEAEGSPPPPADTQHEAELMADPQEALKHIAARIEHAKQAAGQGQGDQSGASVEKERQAPGVGDPFDPKAWEETPPLPPPAPSAAAQEQPSHETPPDAKPAEATTDSKTEAHNNTKKIEPIPAAEQATPGPLEATKNETAASPPKPDGHSAQHDAAAEAQKIARELAQALGTGLDQLPASIAIKSTDEGTLISLTDSQAFGMFKTGSSEPEPEMVRLVGAIAGVLEARTGYIVVRGHTDSRPYRNKRYDNWQLSTARAHFAQYMLVRGGLESGRIRRIEGFADRDLKNPADPQAPENRRIEILLGREPL